jgi:hypothetical protein
MLKRYGPFLLLLTVFVACSKGKLNTNPSIKFKTINGTDFFPGSTVNITLDYTDKEGDLGNGTLTYIRNRTNTKPISDPASNDKIDTVHTPLPDFPKTTTGEISVLIPYSFLDEDPITDTSNPSRFNDTMFFKILVRDVAGNVSDTVISPTIVQRTQ